MITLYEALMHIYSYRTVWGKEIISIEKSLNRVLAEDIYADRDYPPFNRSAVDGYAISTDDILKKNIKNFRIAGRIFAGENNNYQPKSGEAVKIMTGAAVPYPSDAVIKKEDSEEEGGNVYFKIKHLKKYQNISVKGEDIKKGNLVINKHIRVTPAVISTLASLGKNKIKVFSLPKVGVISTGAEIKNIDKKVEYFQIRDSNSYTIEAMLQELSIEPEKKIIINDEFNKLKINIEKFLIYDILITTGSVSEGDSDFLPAVFRELGIKEVFHKVKIKPGKPVWFGAHPEGMIVFALPGNPFSVQVLFKIFVEYFLNVSFNISSEYYLKIPLNEERKKRTLFDEFFPVKLLKAEYLKLIPVIFNGSGDIKAALSADGFALHPSDKIDISRNELLNFYPFNGLNL